MLPVMAEAETTEEKNRRLAAEVVDLFMPDDDGLNDQQVAELELANEPKIVALFEGMEPVTAAAVAVQVCYELDPEEIAEFLAILEGDDGEGDEAAE